MREAVYAQSTSDCVPACSIVQVGIPKGATRNESPPFSVGM